MDKMIEVRYAGVVVGRSTIVRELDTRGLFLGVTEPLPVGTPVALRLQDWEIGKEVLGKVEIVSESLDLPHAGMRIAFGDPAAAALFGTPSEAPPAPPEPVAPIALAPDPPAASAGMAVGQPPEPQASSAPPGPDAAVAPTAHRRIVVDASTEKAQPAEAIEPSSEAAVEPASGDDADLSTAVAGEGGRIAAPDPSAFSSGGGGKKGRRRRR